MQPHHLFPPGLTTNSRDFATTQTVLLFSVVPLPTVRRSSSCVLANLRFKEKTHEKALCEQSTVAADSLDPDCRLIRCFCFGPAVPKYIYSFGPNGNIFQH